MGLALNTIDDDCLSNWAQIYFCSLTLLLDPQTSKIIKTGKQEFLFIFKKNVWSTFCGPYFALTLSEKNTCDVIGGWPLIYAYVLFHRRSTINVPTTFDSHRFTSEAFFDQIFPFRGELSVAKDFGRSFGGHSIHLDDDDDDDEDVVGS